jgi:hypothetical protein
MNQRILSTIALAGLLSGCAGMTLREAASPNTNGIRYFRPATYVLVKPDYVNASASLTFFQVADTSKTFAIAPYSFMANNTTEIAFTDGILTKLDSQFESTAVAKSVADTVRDVVKAALDTAAKAAASGGLPAPTPPARPEQGPPVGTIFLFKIDPDPNTGSIAKQLYPQPNQSTRGATP